MRVILVLQGPEGHGVAGLSTPSKTQHPPRRSRRSPETGTVDRKYLRPVGYVVAVISGLPASFVVGAAVFADGPPLLSAERLVPVVITYLVIGATVSFILG